jgi:hypothetical protein
MKTVFGFHFNTCLCVSDFFDHIYNRENINLASYGQDHADVGAKGGKPVLGPK